MNVRNYIHLTGNLGAAPTTFVLPSGDLTCKFSLATNEYYRNKDGEKVTRTEWHTVRAYGKLAEIFAEHLDKGSQIAVVGSMRYRQWEDKYQQKRSTPEVIASEFTFLSASRQTDAAAGDEAMAPAPAAPTRQEIVDAEIEEILAESFEAPAAPVRKRAKTVTRRTKSGAKKTAAAAVA